MLESPHCLSRRMYVHSVVECFRHSISQSLRYGDMIRMVFPIVVCRFIRPIDRQASNTMQKWHIRTMYTQSSLLDLLPRGAWHCSCQFIVEHTLVFHTRCAVNFLIANRCLSYSSFHPLFGWRASNRKERLGGVPDILRVKTYCKLSNCWSMPELDFER